MMYKKAFNNRLTEEELEKIQVEKYVQAMFSRDGCRASALNAARYLEKNGPSGILSDSAIDVIDGIALAFAAGEIDWVKDVGREEDEMS